jgi:hypothetical protein
LLGVTPELADLPFTQGIAVDGCAEMVTHVWKERPNWEVFVASWKELSFLPQVEQVVGDGVFSVVKFPDDYYLIANQLKNHLSPDSNAVFRVFAFPYYRESLEEIYRKLDVGKIKTFHALKWHVAMCREIPVDNFNVKVTDILGLFNQAFPDREALLEHTKWDASVFTTLDVYEGSDAVRSFPPMTPIYDFFRKEFSDALQWRHNRGNEISDRCPIFAMSKINCTI